MSSFFRNLIKKKSKIKERPVYSLSSRRAPCHKNISRAGCEPPHPCSAGGRFTCRAIKTASNLDIWNLYLSWGRCNSRISTDQVIKSHNRLFGLIIFVASVSQLQNPFWSAILYESIQTGVIMHFFTSLIWQIYRFTCFFILKLKPVAVGLLVCMNY